MKANKQSTPRGSDDRVETVFTGVAVGAGVVIGDAVVHAPADLRHVARFTISASRVEKELARLRKAISDADARLDTLSGKSRGLPAAASEELGFMLGAYQQMLRSSRLVGGIEHRISDGRINAEAAVAAEIADMEAAFRAMSDPYLAARADDIREVGRQIIERLSKRAISNLTDLPNNTLLIASELSPADLAQIDTERLSGFATELGGAESHTAIMARSLSIPACVAVPGMLRHVRSGAVVIVDGSEGTVTVNPTPQTLAAARKKRANFLRARRNLIRYKDRLSITRDGQLVRLQANIELPGEADTAMNVGAEGIGLLRSEFLYMNRSDLPDEDEQTSVFERIVEKMDGRPVTIRTLDVGGDKVGGGLDLRMGANPAMGLRAIRFALARPDILKTQLRAILRAGARGPVRILLPMVSGVDEITATRALLDEAIAELRAERRPYADPPPPVGVMIEIPAAAMTADALADQADFFAIGTNDLTQYTLAIDRTDEAVGYLYNPLHPAVLRLIQFTAEAARRAEIPVSVCGEMAGDPRLAPLFLGFGITDLSMAAASLLRVKQRVLKTNAEQARTLARDITLEADPAKIAQRLDLMGERV